MRRNRTPIIIFLVLLIIYIVAQLNAPKKFDWTPTLSRTDKNPFGAYIPYSRLQQLFPASKIISEREPVYNVLHNEEGGSQENTAYFLIGQSFNPGKADLEELLKYVDDGNTAFISALQFSEKFLDTLGLKIDILNSFLETDSTAVNLVNPSLRAQKNYGFKPTTFAGYFNKMTKPDSTVVIGIDNDSLPNFVRVQYGKGYFYVHAAPLCFSNYFMLYNNNAEYTANALSYVPAKTAVIYWDEYYKSGREGAETPLRFFLSKTPLKWALYLTIVVLLLYVFFEMKRKQRVIPVIEPLKNSTLEFVETVSGVYLSRHDNNSIALKKIQFWFDHIRNRYYLSTNETGEYFVAQLQRKTGVSKELIDTILLNIKRADAQPVVTDDLLMKLCSDIDEFYRLSKI